jgi:hypothetical protein
MRQIPLEAEVGRAKVRREKVSLGCLSVVCSVSRWPAGAELIDLLGKEKTPVISTPYDPIHLTHVGFDYNTGQCA